jgi:co-chaperonin GroES (HSP10)
MLRPMRNKLVVKPQARKVSDIIFVSNKEPFNEGTIVAIGTEVLEAKIGDFIKYGNGDYLNWPTHTIDGQDFQIISEKDICAIVEAV